MRPELKRPDGARTKANSPAGIGQRIEAARQSAMEAIHDMAMAGQLHHVADVARSLRAILSSMSPDDEAYLRQALLAEIDGKTAAPVTKSDDELAKEWRDGGYPYRHL